MKQYFETSDLWDEEILGVFEDSLECNPFLSEEQKARMITLMYSRFYSAKVGEKVNMPFEYNIPSKEQIYTHNSLSAAAHELLEALEALVERAEAVADGIVVEKRNPGVSQATHVAHMASHLAQHAKIARVAIAKAKGE